MQVTARGGTRAHNVARVLGDFRFDQNDMKHSFSLFVFYYCTQILAKKQPTKGKIGGFFIKIGKIIDKPFLKLLQF
jgi:hypothetical protein